MNTLPSLALIGGLGTPEIVLIFVVLLLLFGAKKLPELARGIGKSAGEFKRAREEFENEIKMSEAETAKKPEPKATTASPAIDASDAVQGKAEGKADAAETV